MKKVTMTLLVLVLFIIQAKAQILTPVKWSYAAKKVGKGQAVILIKATLDRGWHLYSQFVKEGGPVKTTITFAPSKSYVLVGKTQEPAPVTKFEKTFSMNVSYFENSVIFQQKIKLNTASAVVKGTVEFMVCDDQQCLPPDEVEFSIPVK